MTKMIINFAKFITQDTFTQFCGYAMFILSSFVRSTNNSQFKLLFTQEFRRDFISRFELVTRGVEINIFAI